MHIGTCWLWPCSRGRTGLADVDSSCHETILILQATIDTAQPCHTQHCTYVTASWDLFVGQHRLSGCLLMTQTTLAPELELRSRQLAQLWKSVSIIMLFVLLFFLLF